MFFETKSCIYLGNLFVSTGYMVDSVNPYMHKWPPNYMEIAKEGREVFEQAAIEYGKKRTDMVQIKIVAHKEVKVE